MSINHITSSLMIHPIFNSLGQVIRYEPKQTHQHSMQVDGVVKPSVEADYLSPHRNGQIIDLKV